MVNLGRPFGFPPSHFSSFLFLKNLFSNTLPPAIASKKMDAETKKDRFVFATIMAAIWSLKFVPRNVIGITFVVILYLLFLFLTIWVVYKSFRKNSLMLFL